MNDKFSLTEKNEKHLRVALIEIANYGYGNRNEIFIRAWHQTLIDIAIEALETVDVMEKVQ